MSSRQKLIAKIKAQPPGGYNKPFPVVSLEDFFNGNNDLGSIGCNLEKHPGLAKFYSILHTIIERPEVQTVLVTIYEVVEEDTSMWPFSERVYVLTSATPEQLRNWASELQPDEVLDEGFVGGASPAAPPLKDGMKVLSLWWD
jgi:hypothetical protein